MLETKAWLARWWIPLLFVACQLPFLIQPLGGMHKWRQADTAAVARNLAFESADPFHPRIDMRGDRSGITGMEFPVYQSIVAAGLVLVGDRDAVGKLVSLLAACAAGASLAALLVRRLRVDHTSAWAAIALSPLLFHYAAKVMPETTALALACIALERTDAWITGRLIRDLALASAALALAALVRPYVIFAGAPLLLAWISGFANRTGVPDHRRPLGWDAALAGILAAIPFLVWFYLWCPHLVRTYGIDYFFTGNPLRKNLGEMGEIRFWPLLLSALGQHVVNWIALPVFIFGLWQTLRLRRAGLISAPAWWLVLGIPGFAIPSLLLLIGSHFSPHNYYFLVLVAPTAAIIALGLHALRGRWPHAMNAILPMLLVASVLQWSHAWRGDRGLQAYDNLLGAGGLPDDRLVAIENRGHLAWHLHPLRARGWVVSRAGLEDADTVSRLRQAGMQWIVITDDRQVYRLHDAGAWLDRLDRNRSHPSNTVFPPLSDAATPAAPPHRAAVPIPQADPQSSPATTSAGR